MKIVFNILIQLALFGFNCNNNRTFREAMPPPRVDGVPRKTFWRGGVDGGNWFAIDSISQVTKMAVIRVYKSSTGELVENRRFKFNCNSIILWDKLEEQIEMFDGQKILLRILPEERNRYCYLQ